MVLGTHTDQEEGRGIITQRRPSHQERTTVHVELWIMRLAARLASNAAVMKKLPYMSTRDEVHSRNFTNSIKGIKDAKFHS